MSYTNGVSNIDWDNLEKPWTFEACRERYIYDEGMTFRKLARLSGRQSSYLSDWASAEHPPNKGSSWVDQRTKYINELRTTTYTKTLEKTSDKLSDQFADIVAKNYEVQKLLRDYAALIIKLKARKLKGIDNLPQKEIDEEIEKNHKGSEMLTWARIQQIAISGMENSLGLSTYVNAQAAISRVEREGYLITNPADENAQTEEDKIVKKAIKDITK